MRLRDTILSGAAALLIATPVLTCGSELNSPAQAGKASIRWTEALDQNREWYASTDALRIADNLILYQRQSGGWPKNIDMAAELRDADRSKLLSEKADSDSTIDNGATFTQLVFLARVYSATRQTALQKAFLAGLDYLLAAQYDNGGWPQYFPIRKGYYQHITFNDGAMIGVMQVLRDVAEGRPHYRFVDNGRRERAARAVERGIECVLKTQVIVRGKRTVWCAQHDEITLAPAPARTYEPVSLSGLESVGVVKFLMQIDHPNAAVIESIESAVAWFRGAQLSGVRWIETRGDHTVVADSKAPPLWARFYEIGTNRPIFSGRDAVIKYSVAEIESERRNGYRWYTEDPANLLNRDYPAWSRNIRPANAANRFTGPRSMFDRRRQRAYAANGTVNGKELSGIA